MKFLVDAWEFHSPTLFLWTPGRPQLCENSREIPVLEKSDFKASNGWLDKWKRRCNIRQITISGESGDVAGETVRRKATGIVVRI